MTTYLHSLIDFSLQIPGYAIPFGILIGCGLADATANDPAGGSHQEGPRQRADVGEKAWEAGCARARKRSSAFSAEHALGLDPRMGTDARQEDT